MTYDTHGTDSIRRVLRFAFRHWARQQGRATCIAFFITAATVTEIFVPLLAGRLIDALAANLRSEALALFAAMAVLGLAMVALRHIAWTGIVPFTLRMMRDVTQDGFHRVQRFSTDWHANSFAGSTVRKITRGMWAFDTLNDVLLLQLLPSLAVLVGTMLLLGWHWPVLGVVMAVGAIAYVAMTVVLATRWASPAATLSNAWDTKLGGLLSDAIGSNAVVKAFGAEEREEYRVGTLLAKWAKRTRRTWLRYTWSGSAQIAVLWAIRAAITGTALWLWWRGAATPGDVTFVLASYFVVHGYLFDIGFHIHHLQRSVNEMEELVDLHEQLPGIEDRADAAPIRITAGEVRFDDVTFRYGGHETPLYEHLDLVIRGGERVGLVGRSGSGKTTFVKLIQRLYDVNEGRVTIDG